MKKPPVPTPHSRIESVKQGPLNPLRWCLQLDCGHDQWVTAKSRPTRQTIRCGRCADRAAELNARSDEGNA